MIHILAHPRPSRGRCPGFTGPLRKTAHEIRREPKSKIFIWVPPKGSNWVQSYSMKCKQGHRLAPGLDPSLTVCVLRPDMGILKSRSNKHSLLDLTLPFPKYGDGTSSACMLLVLSVAGIMLTATELSLVGDTDT